MSITAFPVLARILQDRNLSNTPVGILALSCAAIDDVSAWCMLAVITVLARAEGSEALLVRFAALAFYILAMIFVVRPLVRHLLPMGAPLQRTWFTGIMVVLLGSAWTTEVLSVHALFGAFLAGIVMPRNKQLVRELRERIEWVTVVLLLPLFFAYNGLRTSISLVNTLDLWLVCGLIVLVAIGSKLLISALSVRATGMAWREAFAVGILVNTRGLVELIILNVGLDLRILSPTLFSMMVIMALVTTFMTSPLLGRVYPESLARRQLENAAGR